MNKKGFTLIELLAVIIILAVIALIATPIVLNVIDSARRSAAESSAKGFADAARLHWIENEFAKTTNINASSLTSVSVDAIEVQGDAPAGCNTVEFDSEGRVSFTGCKFGEKYFFNCTSGNVSASTASN